MRKYEWKGSGIVVRMFRTSDGAIHEIQEPQDGCWVALTNPTATEIFEISEQFQIEVDDLRAPLDEEERSRIEVEDTYTLILVDVPMIEERNDKDWYGTIPLGIIVTDKMIFTICLEDTQPGRYTGTDKVYGRTCPQFLYLYEDTFYSADFVSKCKYVSSLSAYH